MLKLQATNRLKNYGLSAVAAGFVFLAGPIAADASDFGGELLTDGIENSHVEQLQDLLIEEGYMQQEDASGAYDNATTDAVTNYQKDQQLLADGLAGVQTLGALKVLEQGDENSLVTDLQETLQETGYYNGSLDGYFDDETRDSVKSFQSDADIAVDGLAGPDTFGVLYYESSEAVEEDVPEDEATEEEATEEGAAAVEEETETTESAEVAVEKETKTTESAEVAVEEETEATESAEATEETNGEASASDDGSSSDAEGETFTMEATAYTADCAGCTGETATGIDLNNNRDANVIAVDPNIIPLGSTVHVEGYGEAVAGDTGGGINGEKIDLHVPTEDEALQFGRQDVEVTVLD
ncbi:peptidoglycan-binding protein [Salicibibacter kimchii]|uniref:Peptidoglycan-binding protein n=1 Tax=Salicibibacter kimchii TaxID=2099786 RepID=A0A345C279_9BACI|nr:peptidoglycan-binding protein [Salicibibacter kimchii]AXF57310.1 peptidoglycan-binding protein [Salicibibacter kimchii]